MFNQIILINEKKAKINYPTLISIFVYNNLCLCVMYFTKYFPFFPSITVLVWAMGNEEAATSAPWLYAAMRQGLFRLKRGRGKISKRK